MYKKFIVTLFLLSIFLLFSEPIIPVWFYILPNNTDQKFVIGISPINTVFSDYEYTARTMATVFFARMIESIVYRQLYKKDQESSIPILNESIFEENRIVVTANPDTMQHILRNISLVDSFKFNNYFYGLYSYPGKIKIDASTLKFDNNPPSWFKKNEILEYQNKIVSCGLSRSINLIKAWFGAFDDALIKISEFIEVNSLNYADERVNENFFNIEQLNFLWTRQKLRNIKLLNANLNIKEEDDKIYYLVYMKIECDKIIKE